MAARKFKFVSPGIFLREIDNSRIPRVPEAVGPVIIGRTRRGPSLVPVKVNSELEFTEYFGTPVPGGQGGDVWRDGNYTAPTYASYAAQAWLANNTPCTIVRLNGAHHRDKTSAGKAGWKTANQPNATIGSNGGALGLFVWSSGSYSTGKRYMTGTLGAIWYLQKTAGGDITLSGTTETNSTVPGAGSRNYSKNGLLLKSTGKNTAGGEWKVDIRNPGNAVVESIEFDFVKSSPKFIRKVFNTNPTKTNSTLTDNQEAYFLGETFETNLQRLADLDGGTSLGGRTLVGAILPLKPPSGGTDGSIFQDSLEPAQTGWFISQDMTNNTSGYKPEQQTKLFKFHGVGAGGAWVNSNIKISIQDIEYSNNTEANPYGRFTVVVRDAKDTDSSPIILERYSNVNLNPNSPDYIARRIGDKSITWDDIKRTYRELGNYPNVSKYIRVEVATDVENNNIDAELLPFGFFGPPRFKSQVLHTNTEATTIATFLTGGRGILPNPALNAVGTPAACYLSSSANTGIGAEPPGHQIAVAFPSLREWLRQSASAGDLGDVTDAYFGIQTDRSRGASRTYDESYIDLVRAKPTAISSFTAASGSRTEASFVFSLDDVSGSNFPYRSQLTDATWTSGSRVAGTSVTAVSASTSGYKEILDRGFNRFTSPIFGGNDGIDIFEMDPFNAADVGNNQTTSYEFNSIKRAIDSVADPERVEMNLLCVPGVDNTALTQHMINVCESRGDALAVIDLAGGYTPRAESKASFSSRKGDVDTVLTNVKSRKINSSYAASYYPWVQVRDADNDQIVWVPPSIVALGTFASSERKSALWFAPAGFNRGGLTEGSAGLTVVGVDGRLTSKERDKLYAENVNPIASFPAEGLVIFGQKTMQARPSALDRINVRRLLIFVKKEISRIAATTLFEQNVRATWNGFQSRAEKFLNGVKVGGGLTDYRVVLDETTTTPDLVDRNILYAKVLLKPARAIEFIAVDFVITRSGASFED